MGLFGANGLATNIMHNISFDDILAAEPIDFLVSGNCLLANLDLNGSMDVDFIADENKWVVDAHGRFCWYRTAARFLAVSSHINPGVSDPLPQNVVSASQFNLALPKILLFAAIGHILETHRTCSNAPEIVCRATDVYSHDDWTVIAVPFSGLSRCEILIAQWWNKVRDQAEVARDVAYRVRMLGALAVANARIRHETNGYNFIIEDLDKPNSATACAFTFPGGDRLLLTDFAKRYNIGNDAWHPLSDQSLENLVDSITGINGIHLPNVGKVPGVSFRHHIGVDSRYTQGWPFGVLGITAIHTGLGLCKQMYSDIYRRQGTFIVNGLPFDHEAAIDLIDEKMSTQQLNNEELKSLRETFTLIVVKAAGYATRFDALWNAIRSTPVIDKICRDRVSVYEEGKNLFNWVREKKCDTCFWDYEISEIHELTKVLSEN